MRAVKTGTFVIFLLYCFLSVFGNDTHGNKSLSHVPNEKNISPYSKIHIPNLQSNSAPATKTAMIMGNGVSVPANFPFVDITVNSNPDTGYIFLDNRGGGGRPYNIIFDNTGSPIWYLSTGSGDERRDFKLQPNGWLTMMVRYGYGDGGWGFIALDENYNYVKTFQATHGYTTDEHELRVLENGGYLLIGRQDTTVDLSQYIPGDNRIVSVRETCIQEFNADDQLILEWPAFDYFDIADIWAEELQKSYGMYFAHMNSIDIDDDNNIILSSRILNEITKINRQTKEMIWRLGGAHNQFTFVRDPLNGFSGQHAVRHTGHNRYSLFDNGNHHNPPVSRAVEYELDLDQMTATMIWQYQNPPGTRPSHYMGNVQRLPNGNTLINWAESDRPKLTEVRPNGEVAFEMNFIDQYECYRVHRFPWDGMSLVPYLIVESHREAVVLIFNKFGDPDVDYYRIYGGTSPNPTALLDTSKVTMKAISNLENLKQYYFRVTAVDKNSRESDFSNEENTFTNFIEPGSNMILNGSFSNNKNDWYFYDENPASATWSIEEGVSHFEISQGGNSTDQILLAQEGIEVIRGEQYRFEFDAWSDAQRTIEAMILQYGGQYTNYSRTGPSLLTTQPTHYSYSFTMEDPTDFNALAIFLMGTSNSDVFLDNISFKRITGSEVSESPVRMPQQYELTGNYPNPFNAQTNISFSVPQKSRVKIDLYNILGKFEQEICNTVYEQGQYQIRFNGNKLSSGIYFCTMEAKGIKYPGTHRDVSKMILIK